MVVLTDETREKPEAVKVELKLSDTALKVLEKRYLRKNDKGEPIEAPEDLFQRVAENIAQADLKYEPGKDLSHVIRQFYNMMTALEFLPNSPTLMNAGRELQQLSACFVLPIEDSMESIFETLKNTALIHKSGGGTGFSFTRLRPKNDIVRSTTGVSSGPVSFMQVFNSATEAIKQGGTRRGANMGILRVDHPDIENFITCKDSNEQLENFNISVGLTEEFMQAVETDGEYNIYNPRDHSVVGTKKATEIFDKIVLQAWKNGEPGIVFLDRINEVNPVPKLGEIESTNPCGEQPLLPYESCNLGSINLTKMLKEEDGHYIVDWKKLESTVHNAIHFLDNVIDMNNYPLDKISEMTRGNRKVGLGVMGWADMLVKLGISYASTESFRLAERIMGFVQKSAKEASKELAKMRGPFPNYLKSIYATGEPMRNATVTTIAPTGTIGLIADCSGGIEPLFALVYTRSNVLGGEKFKALNADFENIAKEEGFYSDELIEELTEKGTVQKMKEVPTRIKRIFMTALDIPVDVHIRMQAAFQKYVDNAVSKTINFPASATKEEVSKAYMLSYQLGCKGVTIYRDKSRDKQVLNVGKETSTGVTGEKEKKPRYRPRITNGRTLMMKTGCGKMYVTINEDEHGICELFTQLGKSGGCTASQSEAIGRLISLLLRTGTDVEEVIAQLKGIRCPTPMITEGTAILSCADAAAKALEEYMRSQATPDLFEHKKPAAAIQKTASNIEFIGACPQCPECGEMLVTAEGCIMCTSCGYSRCW